MTKLIAAHAQLASHRYLLHFPEHGPRAQDPHYPDFEHYHRRTRATARCVIGQHIGYGECSDAQGNPCPPGPGGPQPGLELHHAHIEFALTNGVDLAALERDYPGVSDASQVGAWIESAANLEWLCAWHHRGAAGAHTAAYADFEAGKYVRGLITRPG